jgi:thymidylate synthase
MKNYLDLLQKILDIGIDSEDRTKVGTKSLFGEQLRFDLNKGFPAVTTKKLAWKSVVSELLWFIEGSSDERRLAEILYGTRDPSKTTIWTANANSPYWKTNSKYEGDCGRIYGIQLRHWVNQNGEEFDQLTNLINNLKNDPYSRRHIIMFYNPGELYLQALPACHMMAQFYVRNKELSCQVYIRSNDIFIGNPFNIASYALLTHMIAHVCSFTANKLIINIGDGHIYNSHINAAKEQLIREPYELPILQLNPLITDITKFTMDDIKLINYKCHPTIKAEMAV